MYAADEFEQSLAALPQLTVMFSQTSTICLGTRVSFLHTCHLPEDRGKTHKQSLTEVQCIIMKIKDILIAAAKCC